MLCISSVIFRYKTRAIWLKGAIFAQVLASRTLSSSVCDGPAVVRRWLCLRRVASQAELLPTHCGECVARDVFLVDGRLHCCASRC